MMRPNNVDEIPIASQSEAVKKIHFIFCLLREMGISVNFPIMVSTGKVSTIFMEENASSGVRTRHIDTRCHFIREHVEDGFIKTLFLKSEDKRHVVKFSGKIDA
jgi:hypothetical protein